MARRRRGQFPKPQKEKNLWKIRYWTDQAQPDGSITRVRKTKCLGRVDEMTYREARKAAQQFLEPVNEVKTGIEHREKTVSNLITKWRVAVKPNLKRSTQESYEWAFKRIEKAFGHAPIAEIEKADVQIFLTAAAQTLAPESIYDLRNRLSGLFTSAEEWGWIEAGTNPVRGKLRLPDRVAVRKKRILTPEQFRLLQMALGPPYDVIVLLAVLSGLRKGEIEALRWNDVQLGRLEVDEAVYLREIGSPKSRKSRRRVTIGAAVQQALSDWRQRARFTASEDFIFAIRTNTPVDLHNVVARHVKPACQKLGIPLVSWHDLRHTYTTWGRRAGIKAEVMRDQLGHESVQVTLDIYSHADDHDEDVSRLEAYALAVNGTPIGTPTHVPLAATH